MDKSVNRKYNKGGREGESETSGEKDTLLFKHVHPFQEVTSISAKPHCSFPLESLISSATFGATWPPLPSDWNTDRLASHRKWFCSYATRSLPPLCFPLPPPPPPPLPPSPPPRQNEGRVGGGGWTDLQRVQRVAARAQDQSDGVHARPGECARGTGVACAWCPLVALWFVGSGY